MSEEVTPLRMEIRNVTEMQAFLRRERLRLGLTEKDAAERAHLSRMTFHRLEEGGEDPKLGNVIKAIHSLGSRLFVYGPPNIDTRIRYWGMCPECAWPFAGTLAPEPASFERTCSSCGTRFQVIGKVRDGRWIVPVQVERGGNWDG